MNKAMQSIYRNVLKFGMKVSLMPIDIVIPGQFPHVLCIHVGWDGSALKYRLLPSGPEFFMPHYYRIKL